MLRQIGRGGMSTVYLAYDEVSGQNVAIKVLADHLAYDPLFVDRFTQEGELHRSLFHPHLVAGRHSGRRDPETGQHYFVMEHIDGPTVEQLLDADGPLPAARAVYIARQIADALDYLHTQGYVHRDIKPGNVLITPEGDAKLIDLGLAKAAGDPPLPVRLDLRFGTPHYMPPEQARAGRVGRRGDIYSLGATLYHMLTGELPFPGDSAEEIARRKQTGRSRPARSVNPDVPEDLDRAVTHMLQRDPGRRPATARAVIAELDAAGADKAEAAAAAEYAWVLAPATAAASVTTTRIDLPVMQAGAPWAPKWGLVLAASVGMAAAGAGGVWWACRDEPAPPPPPPKKLPKGPIAVPQSMGAGSSFPPFDGRGRPGGS